MTPDPISRTVHALAAAAAAGFALISYVYLTLPDVRPLATSNPTTTAFMELRAREEAADGRKVRRVHRWVPYSRISQHLKRAVLVAEDSAFWDHEGIDVEQIRRSIQDSLSRGQPPRGASTITQQLAKNLYLSPSRDPFRKLKELIIARRLEVALSKSRILEIYLNVVEWGDEVWGAEAAARTYFGLPASSLSASQAALLAGALINPRTLNPGRPPRRLLRRQRIILARMGSVEPPALLQVTVPAEDAPDVEAAPPQQYPLSVDEEEAQEGEEPEAPDVPESAPPSEEKPPA